MPPYFTVYINICLSIIFMEDVLKTPEIIIVYIYFYRLIDIP